MTSNSSGAGATNTTPDVTAPEGRSGRQHPGLSAVPVWVVVTTILIAALVLVTSLLGLFAAWPYALETANWRMQGRGQDVGNLVAVAVLLAGLGFAARGRPQGRQVWAGSLMYLAYAFVIYAMGVHFGRLFLAYVGVLGLSVYSLILGLPWWTGGVSVAPRARTVGSWVLTAIAVCFALLWLSSILASTVSGQPPTELVETGLVANPVHVLDLAVVLPGMVITGHLARRGREPAQAFLAAWLVLAAIMGASIVVTLLLLGTPAPAVVVGVMSGVSAVTAIVVLRATTGPHKARPLIDVP